MHVMIPQCCTAEQGAVLTAVLLLRWLRLLLLLAGGDEPVWLQLPAALRQHFDRPDPGVAQQLAAALADTLSCSSTKQQVGVTT